MGWGWGGVGWDGSEEAWVKAGYQLFRVPPQQDLLEPSSLEDMSTLEGKAEEEGAVFPLGARHPLTALKAP